MHGRIQELDVKLAAILKDINSLRSSLTGAIGLQAGSTVGSQLQPQAVNNSSDLSRVNMTSGNPVNSCCQRCWGCIKPSAEFVTSHRYWLGVCSCFFTHLYEQDLLFLQMGRPNGLPHNTPASTHEDIAEEPKHIYWGKSFSKLDSFVGVSQCSCN